MLCMKVMLLWKKDAMYRSNVIMEEGDYVWK